ncbi:hypothetical protein [Zhihengliuella flava]|uniref:Glycine zipper domain-containing protein n=1 Tax=Zhihengliuella flava TaxID=1285193 RepID=A0A931D770_9MICC|nr:hypothetical protein [Zhihengliuella flava]MBG6084940.1 hypothetical protein [Zhihengliuella flava]
MTVSTTNLPESWPDAEAINNAAEKVRKVGTRSREIYDDVATTWSGLSGAGVFESPHQAQVLAAPTSSVEPFILITETSTENVAKALEDFGEAMGPDNKQRYDDVLIVAQAHNNISFSSEEDKPENYHSDQVAIQREIDQVATLYDEAVQDCARAINQENPMRDLPAGVAGAHATYKNVTKYLKKAGVHSANFKVRRGQLLFVYNTEVNPYRKQFPTSFKINRKILEGLHVPQSYIDRLTGEFKGKHKTSYGQFERWLEKAGKRTPLGLLLAKYPHLKRTRIKFDGMNIRARAAVTPTTGMKPLPSNSKMSKTKLTKALERLNKLQKTPLLKGVAVVSAGLNAYDNYTDAYADSMLRDPDKTPAEHRQQAVTDAAIKTGAETVGATVGTAVGRGVGAAVGQAIIPIPGVGAAVGGFVGGLAGGYLGGKVGGFVGDQINNFLHSDTGEKIVDGIKDVGSAAVDKGKEVLSSLNPFD